MAKTRRLIGENLKLVDIVIELCDARIPRSSRNPEIETLCRAKPRLTLLTKSSLASPEATKEWIRALSLRGANVMAIDSQNGYGISQIAPKVREILSEKIKRYEEKGAVGRSVRAMIVGIPNVGKSSLVNRLTGAKKAKVEDRPGVTRDKQWVPTSIGIDLLDTPGILWPKFDDRETGENLAFTGAIKDDILDTEELAAGLCMKLLDCAPQAFLTRYKLDEKALEGLEMWEIFESVGRKRGFLISGGEIDYDRTANVILDEFRSGKLGPITLEKVRLQQSI